MVTGHLWCFPRSSHSCHRKTRTKRNASKGGINLGQRNLDSRHNKLQSLQVQLRNLMQMQFVVTAIAKAFAALPVGGVE